MEFDLGLQFNMGMNPKPSLEFEDGAYVDDDDDGVFFAEIRRQILLLTADNEDFSESTKRSNSFRTSVTKRSLSCSFHPSAQENENTNSSVIPASLANLWRNNSNGTGVFIPQIVPSRRNYRPRRLHNEKRIYKAVENKH